MDRHWLCGMDRLRWLRVLRHAAAAAMVCGAAACSCPSPTSPSSNTGTTNTNTNTTPTGTSTPTLVGVTVAGKTALSVGDTTPLSATASFSDGSSRVVTNDAQWITDNHNVCTTSGAGVLSAVSGGSCQVSAVYAQAVGHLGITIAPGNTPPVDPPGPQGPQPKSLSISGASSIAVGASAPWTATVVMTDGHSSIVTSAATWASLAPAIASVSGTGVVSGQTPGATTITAFFQGVSTSAPVTITAPPPGAPTVTGLDVTGSAAITVGQTAQLQAVAHMSDGSSATVTTLAAWSAGDPSIASVQTGMVTGKAAGSTPVVATFGGKSAQTTATVTNPPPGAPTVNSLSITGTPTVTVGQTTQLQAVAQMSDGSQMTVTGSASWQSGSPSTATVQGGLVTGQAAGSTPITAGYGGKTAQVTVTVNAAPKQLVGIEADADTDLSQIALGQAFRLHVYGLYSDGSKSEVTSGAALTPDDPLVHVDNQGTTDVLLTLADALTDPTHVINVSYGGFTTSVNFTMKTPLLNTMTIGTGGGPLSLSAGSQLPPLQAVTTDGVHGTLDSNFPGVTWQMQPTGALGSVLNVLGTSLDQALTVSNGQVSTVSSSLLSQIASLTGGVIPVNLTAAYSGVTSSPRQANISPN